MTGRQDKGGTGQGGQGKPRPGHKAEGGRKEEAGHAGGKAEDQEIRTPGGNLRYGGGNAQGIPMVPDDETSR